MGQSQNPLLSPAVVRIRPAILLRASDVSLLPSPSGGVQFFTIYTKVVAVSSGTADSSCTASKVAN